MTYEWTVTLRHATQGYGKSFKPVASTYERAIDGAKNELRDAGYDSVDQEAFDVILVKRGRIVTQVDTAVPSVFTTRAVVAGHPLNFVWHGGQYIDICWAAGPKTGSAFEVINVWDAGSDEPSIARTHEAFKDAVQKWIDDPEADRANDLKNYAF